MNALLSLDRIFLLIGLVLMLIVVMTLRDRKNPKRITTALFWALIASTFLLDKLLIAGLGKPMAHRIVGAMVVVVAGIAGFRGIGRGAYEMPSGLERQATAERLKNWIFVPALVIPIVTVACSMGLKGVSVAHAMILDEKNVTLAALTVASLAALASAWVLTKGTPLQAVRESRRLIDGIGWAIMLPMMLAMLGGVFVAAKTGDAVTATAMLVVPENSRFLLVVVYCVGMALFSMVMGNAFAAFPVMTAGIALPLLVRKHGLDPAPLVAMGMVSGYCGTLMTPMAANFNIVPAALLELKDKYRVIFVQAPTALLLLGFNIALMYFIVLR